MKRVFASISALALVFFAVACASTEGPTSSATATSSAAVSAPLASEAVASDTASMANDDALYSQHIIITNSTGFDIYELYITPTSQETFGEDLLGEDIFPGGETFEFESDVQTALDETWDIFIVDSEGNGIPFFGVNFSESVIIEIGMGEDGATPTVTTG